MLKNNNIKYIIKIKEKKKKKFIDRLNYTKYIYKYYKFGKKAN